MPDSVWQKTGGVLTGKLIERSKHGPHATLPFSSWQHRSPKLLSLSDYTARPTITSLHLQQLSDSFPYLFLVERPSIASITTLSTYIIHYVTNPTLPPGIVYDILSYSHDFLFHRSAAEPTINDLRPEIDLDVLEISAGLTLIRRTLLRKHVLLE
jgi:hypothetical protein